VTAGAPAVAATPMVEVRVGWGWGGATTSVDYRSFLGAAEAPPRPQEVVGQWAE
jgi:hypothetical protein